MRRAAGLFAACAVLLSGLFVMERATIQVQKPHAPLMLAAAEKTQAAFDAIKDWRVQYGREISPLDDPARSGLIGLSYSEITTTLGALEAKRTTVNPNAAAMVVDMLCTLGIKTGDKVAVNLSGSFPAMNIAVLCACEAMKLDAVVISSVGASTYGANDPDFFWQDMEQILFQKGIITNKSVAVSLGGQNDMGKEFDAQVKQQVLEKLAAYGYPLLSYPTLEEGVSARLAIYDSPAVLINVGGNLVAFGENSTLSAQNGILKTLPQAEKGNGLIAAYLQQGTPVIHLLNMKDLMPAYGLPYHPVTQIPVGQGGVYLKTQLPLWAACCGAVCAMLATGIVFLTTRKTKERAGQGA